MDPESLLFVEVVGMIGIAGFLTLSLRGEERPGSSDVFVSPDPVATTVLCPGWKCNAGVIIGVKGDGTDLRLGITACDLLLQGEACNEGCITAVARA